MWMLGWMSNIVTIYTIRSKCICEKLAEDPMREREWYDV